jgi:hypothetical protein
MQKRVVMRVKSLATNPAMQTDLLTLSAKDRATIKLHRIVSIKAPLRLYEGFTKVL